MVKAILEKLQDELMFNKSAEPAEIEDPFKNRLSKNHIMNTLTTEERDFVEHIDDEYYKRVKTSEDYYRRKKLILLNLEKL